MRIGKGIPALALLICCSSWLVAQAPLAVFDESMPPIETGIDFHFQLHASGGVPPYVWRVEGGDLPEGINLTPEGVLTGHPTKAGAFTVTLTVEDSGHPAHTINKEFKAEVVNALLLEWTQPPKAHDNRIDGAVQVSNGTSNAFDMTVVIVAVAENGRATAIGYEHFALKAGATSVQIQFGNTLPHGGYVIHADAIAEVPSKNTILRQRLQTAQALQIMQGP
jgi:putative Ig domain-containing protein